MKRIPLIVAIFLVVVGCNLSERLKRSGNSNSSSSGTTAGGEPVEQASPTAAQAAAIANGQTVKWDQQGITWTLPASWRKQSVSTNSFSYGGDGAFLIVSISPMDSNLSTEVSLQAFHDSAKTRMKNGEVDELKWLAIDGARGVEFREAKPQMADDIRRLQWMTYRSYAGQTQLVNFILSTNGGSFPKHQDELYGILYSTKIVH
jgi:hypothetical protein